MRTLFVIGLLLIASAVQAATVKLEWDAISDPAVTKVNIYQSQSATAPKPWTLKTSVNAPATVATLTITNSGQYYWYATAASATQESAYSNEVAGTIPLSSPSLRVTIIP